MLSKLSIAQKIYAMGTTQLLLILLVGWIGLSQMQKIGVEIVDITEEDIPLTNALTLLTEHQLKQAILFERALLNGALMQQDYPDAKQHFEEISAQVIELNHLVEKEIIEVEHFIEKGIPFLHSQVAVDEFKKLLEQLKKVEVQYVALEEQIVEVFTLIGSGEFDKGIKLAHSVEELEDELDKKLTDMLNEVQAFTLNAARQAEHDEKQGIKKIAAVLVVSVILGIVIPLVISRTITKPINLLRDRLYNIAHGDGNLCLRLDDTSNDETGQAAKSFNEFMDKLSRTIRKVHQSANRLGESSETAIAVMEKTSSNVEDQRGQTAMVSSAIEEMSTATQHVAKNTAEAAKVAENAKTRVSDGKQSAIETQSIIKQLASEVSTASSVIESLAAETDNIGNVLEAIRGIAEQTNLLALNAAIEAARAGDTGRGFAVVADEVRSLAQRTQSSTGDIQKLVESLQNEAQNAVNSMQKGASSTEKCLEKSDETAAALEDASQAVNSISDLNVQIASTAEEQSAASEQIKDNVDNITRIAEQTSADTVATAEANQAVAKNLVQLHTYLNQFQTECSLEESQGQLNQEQEPDEKSA